MTPTVAEVRALREALQQCLIHIEADETTHGRKFGAGNVARAALSRTEQTGRVGEVRVGEGEVRSTSTGAE
jgi:hypothetical protein